MKERYVIETAYSGILVDKIQEMEQQGWTKEGKVSELITDYGTFYLQSMVRFK